MPSSSNPKVPHGTHNGYSNYRCRCSQCRTAYRLYAQERKEAQEYNRRLSAKIIAAHNSK